QSGRFVVQVPTVALLDLTNDVGSRSLADDPDKLRRAGVSLLRLAGDTLPFVDGCSAWLECRLIPEPHNQASYDLFIG
ncbi:flavin reductase family protein, partial [Lactobacillus delbrueckii]|uniref:flavin reductase family protein n=1 Tax=Lactobacillus delbrueckii TaxID=1584 RepID=UPI0030E9A062